MATILFKVVRIYNSHFKWYNLKKENLFLKFLFHFWISHQILNILKEKMIAIANVFPKLQTVKILVRPLSKKRPFRTRFERQYVKASQILPKSPWESIYHVFSSFSGKLIWKMSPLGLGEILGVFVETVTADSKYPVPDFKNFQLPIQMQLSEKRKTFSQFLFHLSMLREILNILKEKMIVIANMFPKLQTVKIFVRKLSQEHRFRTGFGSQQEKASQLTPKSPRERFYHVLSSFSGKLI